MVHRFSKVRGKLLGNMIVNGSSWVYGLKLDDNKVGHIDFDNKDGDYFHNVYQVLPDSIGLSIGYEDMNGVEIYQGDILKTFTSGKIPTFGYVDWVDSEEKFCLIIGYNSYIAYTKFDLLREYQVSSNITDNPLLYKAILDSNIKSNKVHFITIN